MGLQMSFLYGKSIYPPAARLADHGELLYTAPTFPVPTLGTGEGVGSPCAGVPVEHLEVIGSAI